MHVTPTRDLIVSRVRKAVERLTEEHICVIYVSVDQTHDDLPASKNIACDYVDLVKKSFERN